MSDTSAGAEVGSIVVNGSIESHWPDGEGWRTNKPDSETQTTSLGGTLDWSLARNISGQPGVTGLAVQCCGTTGTTIALNAAPYGLMSDTKWTKGYWVTGAAIEMGISVPSGTCLLKSWGPDSSSRSGSYTSGISVNAGFFGGEPTGGVAVSSSWTESMTEMGISDETPPGVGPVKTLQYVQATGQGKFQPGGDYLTWTKNNNTSIADLTSEFLGALGSLRNLGGVTVPPPQATTNMPLLSQGYWYLPANFQGDVTLNFNLVVTLVIDRVTLPFRAVATRGQIDNTYVITVPPNPYASV